MAELWPRIRPQTFTGHGPGLAYAAWFLGRADLVPRLLEHTREVVGRSAISRFWADYHRAVESLSEGRPYRRDLPLRPSGPQVLAERQMAVIEAITSGEDPTDAIAAMDVEFQRANADKRLVLNSVTTINPTGLDPVRFDLARWAILDASGALGDASTSSRDA